MRRAAAADSTTAPASLAKEGTLPPTPAAGIPRKFRWAGAVAIATVVLVTYYPSLRLGFLGEIWNALQAAGRLSLPQYMASVLDGRTLVGAYQGLPAALLYLGYQVFRADALGYHVVNLLLHLATVGLFFRTVWELGRNTRLAILSGFVFAGLAI